MDKSLYNFSVTWHNQKGQYMGRCDEFSFLSYLADSDIEAYQGILHLVCDFVEQIESNKSEKEDDQWFAANVKAAIDGNKDLSNGSADSQLDQIYGNKLDKFVIADLPILCQ